MVAIVCLVLGYPYHLSFGLVDLGVVDLLHVGRGLIYVSLFFSITSAYQYMRFFYDAIEAKERRQSQQGA
jgi:CDP-diacylglycerol---glycerol-3-phosphate 3-phosphatidyltransferase